MEKPYPRYLRFIARLLITSRLNMALSVLIEYAVIKYKKERWALYLAHSLALSLDGAMAKK